MEGLDLKDVFSNFMEGADKEKRLENAYNAIAKREAELHPGEKILFFDHLPAEELAIVEAYGRMQKRKLEEAYVVKQKKEIPPELPSPVPLQQSCIPPNQMDTIYRNNALHLLAQSKESADTKISSLQAMKIFLSRVILRNYHDEFYYLENNIYRHLPKKELRRFIFYYLEDVLEKNGSSTFLNQVEQWVNSNAHLQVDSTTEDLNRFYFKNGAVEFIYGKPTFRPIEPRDFFINHINCEYPTDPATVRCPRFDKFLSDISGGNATIIQTIWEMLGYLLSIDTGGKCFFVLAGVGNSGKSVLGYLASNLFNTEAVSNFNIFRFKDRFNGQLRGKRLNVSMDLPNTRLSSEAIGTIKMITGDDGLALEDKFETVGFGNLACKLLFGTNY